MTKLQFQVLNIISCLLALTFLGHFIFVKLNARSGQALERDRLTVSNARQVESVLDQLAKRIAYGSDTDPQLKSILAKHGLHVTLEVDGKKKTYP